MDFVEELGRQVAAGVLPVLASVIAALVIWGLQKVVTKLGIEIDLTREAALRVMIREAIHHAEEKARRAAKLGERNMGGPEKAQVALGFVRSRWPKALPDDLEALIDAELDAMRAEGKLAPRD